MNLPGYQPAAARRRRADRARSLAAIKREQASRSSTPAAASSPPSAADELREFAEKTGIPVAMTVHGPRRASRATTTCRCDMLGMHGTVYSNYAVNEADLLLALGVRFDDRVTGKLERVRQARQDRPRRHRRLGDQQEQDGPHPDRAAT